MSAELSIVTGLGLISAMLAYYAFSFRQSTEEFTQKLSILFFSFSLIFLNLLMYAMVEIAKNTSVTYLQNSVLSAGLRILTYVTVFIAIGYFLIVVIMVIYSLYGVVKGALQDRQKDGGQP